MDRQLAPAYGLKPVPRSEHRRRSEPRAGEIKVVLSHEELAMLLGGIDLSQARHRPWYRSQIANDEVGADRVNTAEKDCIPQLTSATK